MLLCGFLYRVWLIVGESATSCFAPAAFFQRLEVTEDPSLFSLWRSFSAPTNGQLLCVLLTGIHPVHLYVLLFLLSFFSFSVAALLLLVGLRVGRKGNALRQTL